MDLDDLATRLWTARNERTDVEVKAGDDALTLEDAYRLQHNYVRISGERRSGWKVGATNPPMQDGLGLSEPFAGPLLENSTLQSPARCTLVPGQDVIVEVEFVFRMGSDYEPDGPVSIGTLSAAVDAVCPGIEVAGVRYPQSMGRPSTPLIIADAAATIALVYGEPVTQWQELDLASHEAELRINGERIDGGKGSNVLGSPINALAWLAGFLDRQGLALRRGDIVTTGTMTDMQPVKAGDQVVADFGSLGCASVDLS